MALVGLGFASAATAGPQQTPPPSFRTAVDIVPIYATVRDESGHLVFDLDRNDFELLVDGVRTEIAVFSEGPQSLTIAVMLDTSASVTGLGGTSKAAMTRLRHAVLAFMRTLAPSDRASLGSFGSEIAVGAQLTNDIDEFDRIMHEELWGGGGTPLWQAIAGAVTALSEQPGRRVIVVYTDGFDTGSIEGWKGDRKSVESDAIRHDTMVYFVRPPVKSAVVTVRLPAEAVEIAAATGGGFLEIPTDADTDYDAVFARIADELRHQYLLGFSPRTMSGRSRKVEVRAKKNGLTVRARQRIFEAKR
jgi:VWFA-related protein